MKKNDKRIEKFEVAFNAENTLICGTSETLKAVASRELKKLNAKGHIVYITDPYLFPANCDENYKKDLKELLKELEASKIIYCAGNIQNQTLYTEVENALRAQNVALVAEGRLTDCHDRFWLCLETDKCIVFGTSLNGIGRKICRIDELRTEEVEALKDELRTRGIL